MSSHESWFCQLLYEDGEQGLGSFKQFQIDGRLSKMNAIDVAQREMVTEGMAGFRLARCRTWYEFDESVFYTELNGERVR